MLAAKKITYQLSPKFILDQKKECKQICISEGDFWVVTDDSNKDYKREEIIIIDLVRG